MKEKPIWIKLTARATARLGLAPLAVGLLLAVPCATAQMKEADMKSVEDTPTAVADEHLRRITPIKQGGIALGEEYIQIGRASCRERV